MNREELKRRLDELRVNPGFYSLNGELLPDRLVLYRSYDTWTVFYLDERGNRHDEQIFFSEEEACSYLYERLKQSIKFQ